MYGLESVLSVPSANTATAFTQRLCTYELESILTIPSPLPEATAFTQRLCTNNVNTVAVFADGTKVVSGSGDGMVKIWDTESGVELRTLSGHSDWVYAVAVFADGKRVMSWSDDKTVKIWDAESGTKLYTHTGCVRVQCNTVPVLAVAVCADGKRIVSGCDDGRVKIWKMIKYYVPTKRVHDLLLSSLNEDVVGIIMKFAVATKQELKRKQQKTIT